MNQVKLYKSYEPIVTINIYDRVNETVFSSPSLIAVDTRSNMVAAAGEDAMKLKSDTTGNFSVVCPLKNSVVADYTLALPMFQTLLSMALNRKGSLLRKPKIALCIPLELTEVEHKAYEDILYHLGKSVRIVEKPASEGMGGLPADYHVIVEIVPNT